MISLLSTLGRRTIQRHSFDTIQKLSTPLVSSSFYPFLQFNSRSSLANLFATTSQMKAPLPHHSQLHMNPISEFATVEQESAQSHKFLDVSDIPIVFDPLNPENASIDMSQTPMHQISQGTNRGITISMKSNNPFLGSCVRWHSKHIETVRKNVLSTKYDPEQDSSTTPNLDAIDDSLEIELYEHDLGGSSAEEMSNDESDTNSLEMNASLNTEFKNLLAKADQGDAASQYQVGIAFQKGKYGLLDSVPKSYDKALYYFKLSAKQGNPDSLTCLGFCYIHGRGVEADDSIALEYFQEAAETGHGTALFNLGYIYQTGSLGIVENLTKAADLYKKASENGCAKGMVAYATMKAQGHPESVSKEPQVALELLQRAAELDEPSAFYHLGMSHLRGLLGNEKDIGQAIFYLEKASRAGHDIAGFHLGNIYERGIDVPKDIRQATKWWKQSALAGYPPSVYNLAVCYASGYGRPYDTGRAFMLFNQAAKRGHPDAMYNLGVYYMTGRACTKNSRIAFQCYHRAALLGHIQAMHNLGILYLGGTGVPQSDSFAYVWFETAAEKGHINSRFNQAIMQIEGRGTDVDLDGGYINLTICAKRGHLGSETALGDYHLYGKNGVKYDPPKAFEHYTNAANQGHLPAIRAIGKCWSDGIGVDKNYKKAVEWFEKGYKMGDLYCTYNLAMNYLSGQGVSNKNERKAMQLLDITSNQDHSLSQYTLGLIYLGKKDPRAVELLKRAAKQDHPEANFMLGRLYSEGTFPSVDLDLIKAESHLEKAAALNSSEAEDYLVEFRKAHPID